MKTLIVIAHPSRESYTYQILHLLSSEIVKRSGTVEVSDLYAIDFRSDMTTIEYAREGFSKLELPISPDVLEEHKKIERADSVVFLYPVWWSDCPAKLKGWFDRVFSVGYAYKKSMNIPQMRVIKHGVALCTAGYTNAHMRELGIAQSMETIMLTDRLGSRFENKSMIVLGGTLDLENVKGDHQRQILALAEMLTAPN